MGRPFQFSVRTLLLVMLAVAIACAIWIRLPIQVRVAIVVGFVWLFFCIPELLLNYAPPPGRAKKASEERS